MRIFLLVSSNLRSPDGLTVLARIEIVPILVHYQPSHNTSHTRRNRDPLLLADGNLRCGQPRIDFPYYEISGPDICSLICVAVYSNNGDLKSLISPRFNLWHTYYYIWSMYLLLKTRQHPSCAHSGKNFLFCITSNNNLFNQIWIIWLLKRCLRFNFLFK